MKNKTSKENQDLENSFNVLKIDVTYQDTDIGGMVYFANYFNYGEKARSKFLKSLLGFTKINEELNWVVKSVQANYFKPVNIDSTLQCVSEIKELKMASLLFLHSFYTNSELVQQHQVHLCCVNLTGKPVKIPKTIFNAIKQVTKLNK